MSEKENFLIIEKDFGKVIGLYLNGNLDAHSAPELENKIKELLNSGRYYILVNFRNLDYISSAGLGVFMVFIEEIHEHHGDLKLTEMNKKVFSIFDLLGFPVLFDILDKDEQALEKFEAGKLKII